MKKAIVITAAVASVVGVLGWAIWKDYKWHHAFVCRRVIRRY